MNKVLFKETQQFKQGWNLYLILITNISLLIFLFYALYQQVAKGIPVGDRPAPNGVLVVLIIVMIVVLWVSLVMKLEVCIDLDGIHYQIFPIIRKDKLISKMEIQRYEIRKYSAVLNYGGRGIRLGIGRKWEKAFMASGNIGLQLYLANGKKVLFGTQRPQAIIYAMDEMMKLK
jgi:hypothetical protein